MQWLVEWLAILYEKQSGLQSEEVWGGEWDRFSADAWANERRWRSEAGQQLGFCE